MRIDELVSYFGGEGPKTEGIMGEETSPFQGVLTRQTERRWILDDHGMNVVRDVFPMILTSFWDDARTFLEE